MIEKNIRYIFLLLLTFAPCDGVGLGQGMPDPSRMRVVDLTVTVSETLPGNWADMPRFQRWTYNWFEPIKDA